MFPYLFSLTLRKNCNVSTFFYLHVNWNLHFKRDLREDKILDVLSLLSLLDASHLSPISSIQDFVPKLLGLFLYPILFSSFKFFSLTSLLSSYKSLVLLQTPKFKVLYGKLLGVDLAWVLTSDRVQIIFPHFSLSTYLCSVLFLLEINHHLFLHYPLMKRCENLLRVVNRRMFAKPVSLFIT